ncbi:hypothetical protein L7F22_058470 [Adiantum nelumboides]|nr:hypothetical protein [Adiantum nelumboides]
MKIRPVPDCVGTDPNTMDESTELWGAWGKVKDQEALVFFDGGAKANFISLELAARLKITPDRMGPPAETVLAAPGRDVAITPVIGKLRLHCQGYLGHEDFYIMPLEANDRVHAFFESEHFKDGIVPIPGAHQSLVQLAEFCDLVIVTSRQHVIRHQTLEWIERHFPRIFSDVYFGNHFALEGEARPKSEICRSIGAEVLIDDNPRYAVECAQHNIEVLLFDHNNSYPWSKTSDGPMHPLITRVQSWEDVESSLLARAYEKR